MSGIGAVVRTDRHTQPKERKPSERDREETRKPSRPPAKQDERSISEAEERRLNVEA